VLAGLRFGKLNALANAIARTSGSGSGARPVLEAFNRVFFALFFAFYAEWVSSGATITRIGTMFNAVTDAVLRDPAAAVARFDAAMAKPPFVGAAAEV
jgi:hypothetical protein